MLPFQFFTMMREFEDEREKMAIRDLLPTTREKFDEEKFKCDVYFMCREGSYLTGVRLGVLARVRYDECTKQFSHGYGRSFSFDVGLLDQLTSRIAQAKAQVGLKRVKELLNEKYQDETQHCAPLLVASKEGHVEICALLIYEYNVDIETEGRKSPNYSVKLRAD